MHFYRRGPKGAVSAECHKASSNRRRRAERDFRENKTLNVCEQHRHIGVLHDVRSAYCACRPSVLSRLRHVVLLTSVAYAGLAGSTVARSQTTEGNESWRSSTESSALNTSPSRTFESHVKTVDQTVDTKSVQVRGNDGRFAAYEDVETETVKVDAATVRTTTRTFGRDARGAKTLVRITEEEKHTLPNGDSKLVTVTSSAGMNQTLEVAEREIVETKRLGANVEEIKATLVRPTVNGLAPVLKTHEIRKVGANDLEEAEKSTLVPDQSGNWQVSEIRQTKSRRDGNTRISEERIFCRDYQYPQGKMNEVDHIVRKEFDGPAGQKRSTVEIYSVNQPGMTPDGKLRLVERATTVQSANSAGEQVTEQKVDKASAGEPNSGLRLKMVMNDTVRQSPSGTQETRTTRKWDAMGDFRIVSVEMTTSDRIASGQLQAKP